MINPFDYVTTFDIIYAAIAAAALTILISLVWHKQELENKNPYRKAKPAQQKPRLFDGEPGSQPIQRGPEPPANMPASLRGLEGEEFIAQCKVLFAQTQFKFEGVTVTRGDRIRVVTMGDRILEGEFIGMNENGVICVVTARNVVAQKLNRVLEISLLPKES